MPRICFTLLMLFLSKFVFASDPACVGDSSQWSYCVGKTQDANGNSYNGHWVKGALDRVSGVDFSSGAQFIGEWSDGKLSGLGMYVSADKQNVYIGHWKSNQKSGLGINISEGVFFVGEFQGGEESGLGVQFLEKGSLRKLSHFVDGRANGLSITLESDRNGFWTNEVNGKASGVALLFTDFVLKSGVSIREGDIAPLPVSELKQRTCGEVTSVQNNMCIESLVGDGGSKYLGQTDAAGNVPHGWGTYLFAEGAEYLGQYQMGQREGFGTIRMRSGDNFLGDYVGKFSKGSPAFYGAFLFPSGTRYVGEIKGRRPHGHGIEVTSGEVYVGNFFEGKRDGLGTSFMRSTTSVLHEGEWDYGKAVVKGKRGGYTARRKPRDELSAIELVERKFVDEVADNNLFTTWCTDIGEPRSRWTKCRALLERYPEGFYSGDVLDGKFDGIGGLGVLSDVRYTGTEYNGGTYEGEFSAGLFHGRGRLTAHNGNKIFGSWERGRLVGEYLEVNGKTKQVRHLLAD